MSAVELVLLSSSPAAGQFDFHVTPPSALRHQRRPVFATTPSPELPSISSLLEPKRPGALKSGSRAAKVPADAITGFATIASLVKDNRLSLTAGEDEGGENAAAEKVVTENAQGDVKEVARKASVKRPRKTTKPAKPGEEDGPAAKRPRKRKVSAKAATNDDLQTEMATVDQGVDNGMARSVDTVCPTLPGVEKTIKKGRPRKDKGEQQSKIANCRVTKPRSGGTKVMTTAGDDTKASSKTKSTNVKSKHFAANPTTENPVENAPVSTVVEQSLALESALKRRTDRWTPPKETAPVLDAGLQPLEDPETVAAEKASDDRQDVNLMASFGYEKAANELEDPRCVARGSNGGPTVKKRLELVGDASATTRESSAAPKAGASLKKKATTITELATAFYRPQEPEAGHETPQAVPEMSGSVFFAPRVTTSSTNTSKANEEGSTTKEKRARKSSTAAKPAAKAKASSSKTKSKPAAHMSKLLPPDAAMKDLGRQNLLFGTSSQLAREESPTFIRDLQRAFRESEAAMSTQQVEGERVGREACRSKSLAAIKASRGLWAAAARDHDQQLLAVESQPDLDGNLRAEIRPSDLGTEVQRIQSRPETEIGVCQSKPSDSPEDNWVVIGSTPEFDEQEKANVPDTSVTIADHQTVPKKSEVCSEQAAKPSKQTDTHASRTALKSLPPNLQAPKRTATVSGPSKLDTQSVSVPPASVVREEASRLSDAPCKPPRGRPRKSALPHVNSVGARLSPARVNNTTEGSAQTHPQPSTPAKTSLRWTHIDEISDSEPELSPSPPRRQHIPSVGPSLPLSPSSTPFPISKAPAQSVKQAKATAEPQVTNPVEDWNTVRAALFPQITRVIKSTPRTTDPNRPTWHEKILMYDPIVLEDFTIWLNDQGVRVPSWVRKPEKTRRPGKRKKRKPDEDDEGEEGAVERGDVKKLRPWMVQKWCEDMSVCCLWKDGLRGGVKVPY